MSNKEVLNRYRPSDTCPECGAREVYEALVDIKDESESPLTSTIDICGACGKAWEREHRDRPTLEACSNCAFHPMSREMLSGEFWTILRNALEGSGIFYCHKRVPFDVPKEGGTHGFDHKINAAGTRVTNATVCAGWIKAKQREKQTSTKEKA